jgi:hypothetical protein
MVEADNQEETMKKQKMGRVEYWRKRGEITEEADKRVRGLDHDSDAYKALVKDIQAKSAALGEPPATKGRDVSPVGRGRDMNRRWRRS